jgi:hypothetical protein
MATNQLYDRARRQGASPYVAAEYEAYVYACGDEAIRPMSCKAYLQGIDYQSAENVITEHHGTRAGRIVARIHGRRVF